MLKTEPEGCSYSERQGWGGKGVSGEETAHTVSESQILTRLGVEMLGDADRGVICAESQHGRAPQGFESSLQCGPLRPLGGEETELLRLCGRWTGTVSGKSSDPRAVFPSERKQEVHGFSDSGKR